MLLIATPLPDGQSALWKYKAIYRQGESFCERAVHGPGGTLTSVAVPSFAVELDRLFAA